MLASVAAWLCHGASAGTVPEHHWSCQDVPWDFLPCRMDQPRGFLGEHPGSGQGSKLVPGIQEGLK